MATEIERLLFKIDTDLSDLRKDMKKAEKQVDNSSKKISKSLGGVGTALKGLGGLFVGMQVGQFVSDVVRTTVAMDSLERTIKAVTGSQEAANRELQFVREQADRLGLDYLALVDTYKGLLAATKNTNLEGKDTREIFLAASEAAAVLGMNMDDTKGTMRAFIQMVSKGNVQAEELRGQLGERLLGAFQKAAKAMGVTTQQLNKMLEQGKVTAEEMLPKLAKVIREDVGEGVAGAAESARASFVRFGNSIRDLKIAIGESGLVDFLAESAELIAKILELRKLKEIKLPTTETERFRQELAALRRERDALFLGGALAGPNRQEAEARIAEINKSIALFERMEKVATGEEKKVPGPKNGKPDVTPEINATELQKQIKQIGEFEKSLDDITLKALPEQERQVEAVHRAYSDLEDQLADLVDAERVSFEEALTLQSQLTDRMAEDLDKIKEKGAESAEGLKKAFEGWANNMSKDLTDLLFDADTTFGDILGSFGRMITQMLIQQSIVQPLTGAITGSGLFQSAASAIGGFFSSAKGNVFQNFAKGGMLTSPKTFPMANGAIGRAGEAGHEAIMPLTRTAGGELGVKSTGGGMNVTIINNSSAQIEQQETRTANGGFDLRVMISDMVSQDINNGGPIHSSLRSRFALSPQIAGR